MAVCLRKTLASMVASGGFDRYSVETTVRVIGVERKGGGCSTLCAGYQQAAENSQSKASNGFDRMASRGKVATCCKSGVCRWQWIGRQPTDFVSSFGATFLQVSWDWQLESTILFKAVSYLDQYMSQHTVEVLSR